MPDLFQCLSEFRQYLIAGHAEYLLLDRLLEQAVRVESTFIQHHRVR